jgi:hypothetical protein
VPAAESAREAAVRYVRAMEIVTARDLGRLRDVLLIDQDRIIEADCLQVSHPHIERCFLHRQYDRPADRSTAPRDNEGFGRLSPRRTPWQSILQTFAQPLSHT